MRSGISSSHGAAKGGPAGSLRRASGWIAALVVVASVALVAAATYNMALFSRVDRSLDETPAAAAAKSRALDEARSALGNGGLLNALAVYAETGSAQARTDIAQALETADRNVRAFEGNRLTTAESDLARDLHRLIDRYRAAVNAAGDKPQALSGATGLSLMTLHAAVADRIAQLRRQEVQTTADVLAGPARAGFWLGIAAVGAMLATAAATLWLIRLRLLVPLAQLRDSVGGVARGDWRVPVAGTDRVDELGDMARAIEGFRRQVADLPDVSIITENGRVRLKFDGDAGDLFDQLTTRLRSAGDTLAGNGDAVSTLVADTRRDLTGLLSGTQRDLTELLGDTRQELADSVRRMGELCGAVAKAAGDSNREIKEATELLSRAALQVHAFDDRGGGGGLDNLVEVLRRNADLVANTVLTAGEDVGRVVRGLSETEGELRHATSEAQQANERMNSAMGDLQNKLLASVKLLRASGEMLASSSAEATAGLTRATEAVGNSDRNLQAALAHAGDRLERVTGRVEGSAELLRGTADEVTRNLSGALDGLTRANRLIETAAEANSTRLEPVAESLAAVQRDLAGAAAGVALRAGEMTRTLDSLGKISEAMRAELERRSADPDQKAAADEAIARLEATAHALGDRAGSIGDTATRLSDMLAAGLGDAGTRVEEAVRDLQREATSLATDASGATNALNRALARQDEATESLRALTGGLTEALTPRVDPNLATVQSLADGLRIRMEAADRTIRGLLDLTGDLKSLVDSSRAHEQASTAATKDLGDRLAAIAEQLRATAGG
ncbi:HAMP domain-containing protein [Nitrospirillum bahiense]|uniref:HAMP domain-containing protein n=1 Tax=Nitrospirillum amazonense TaxID=28077 RepID=A0A560FUT8_9PROT|nr:HAMP domain-containing protein [Nitrospirillum amazonense]TWB25408.1 HAMP domain-containing protein [Nitrospirillum amazonense]